MKIKVAFVGAGKMVSAIVKASSVPKPLTLLKLHVAPPMTGLPKNYPKKRALFASIRLRRC